MVKRYLAVMAFMVAVTYIGLGSILKLANAGDTFCSALSIFLCFAMPVVYWKGIAKITGTSTKRKARKSK